MVLLLQLHADLPEHIPGHERQLYVFTCIRKACRRKEGSIRTFRASRVMASARNAIAATEPSSFNITSEPKFFANLGGDLFGVKISSGSPSSKLNPFATPSSRFHSPENSHTNTSGVHDLALNLARKVSLSVTAEDKEEEGTRPSNHEGDRLIVNLLPTPFPHYNLDAEYETLDTEPTQRSVYEEERAASRAEGTDGSSSVKDEITFESTIDRTFQRFADRLAQNPLQVIRYEFQGRPLLYSRNDPIGTIFATSLDISRTKSVSKKLPRCERCGAERVFETQLTPQTIAELEAESEALDGMEWGTIIVAVCRNDSSLRELTHEYAGWSRNELRISVKPVQEREEPCTAFSRRFLFFCFLLRS